MSKHVTTLTIRLPAELKRTIDEVCELTAYSQSQFLRHVVMQYVADNFPDRWAAFVERSGFGKFEEAGND